MVTLWKSLIFQWGKKPVLCTCTLCKNDEFCNWKIILFLDSTYKEYWCKIGMAAYSLKAGVFWRAGPAGLLYQNSNETWFGPSLLTPARYSESARNTESFKKNTGVQCRLKLSSPQSEADQNIQIFLPRQWCIALNVGWLHSFFWGEIKYLKQKHNKLFNNSVISRSNTDRPYKTVTFTTLCCNKNVLNPTWFVIRMVVFPTVFSQAGDWGVFVGLYSVLKGLNIWNYILHYLSFGS